MEKSIDLDLAFTSAPEAVLQGLEQEGSIELLTKADPWIQEIKSWVQIFQIQSSYKCPDVVKKSQFLSMGLQFTDETTIAEINFQWRKKKESTDVLSFPAIDLKSIPSPKTPILELGDIIISVPTARKQAREYNHLLSFELRWLVSHGFLHLLGWDHPTKQHLDEMLQLQEQLLSNNVNLHVVGNSN